MYIHQDDWHLPLRGSGRGSPLGRYDTQYHAARCGKIPVVPLRHKNVLVSSTYCLNLKIETPRHRQIVMSDRVGIVYRYYWISLAEWVKRNDFPCHYVYMSHTDTFHVEQQWAWIATAWSLCFVICPSTIVSNRGLEISKYSTFHFDEYEFHQSLTRNSWNFSSVQVTDDMDSCWHFIFVQPWISAPLLWLIIHTSRMISHPENIDEIYHYEWSPELRMLAILQTTMSNASSGMTIFVLWFKYLWIFFQGLSWQ